jgi:hypothetical protein
MSLIFPGGGRTVPLGDFGGYGPRVRIDTPPNPYTYSEQQTNAAQNNARANATQAADPRYNAKQYQRAGISAGKGQEYLGAAKGAQAYAQGMAEADSIGMQDAYANADRRLQDETMRDQFGQALAGLSEQNAQAAYMNQLQSQQRAMGFMGDTFKNFTGMFGGGGGKSGSIAESLLSGLL